MSDEASKFIGNSYVLEDTSMKIAKQPYQLEFFAYEFMGMEVCKDPGGPIDWNKLEPVKEKDGLKEGDRIVFPHPCNGAPWYFTVKKYESGVLYGKNGDTVVSLEFGKDIRGCWVGICFGDTRALLGAKFE